MTLTVDPATNRVANFGYDANGNVISDPAGTYSYDVENRLEGSGTLKYVYDPANQRIYDGQRYTFWSPDGRPLATYTLAPVFSTPTPTDPNGHWYLVPVRVETRAYFGGKLIATGTPLADNRTVFTPIVTDRLGSVRVRGSETFSYFPYGEEKTATVNDRNKFATYYRDTNGLDYANQRYYTSRYGRFMTTDPYMGSGSVADPQSWNRYSYTQGDPINKSDPSGLQEVPTFCDIYPDHFACQSPRSPMSDPGQGPSEPIDNPRKILAIAEEYRSLVSSGRSYDCEALANFATTIALGAPESLLTTAFRVFLPGQFGGFFSGPGVQFTPAAPGKRHAPKTGPGWKQEYVNDDKSGPNVDQVHHFAMFFTIGASYQGSPEIDAAAAFISATAYGWELISGTPGNTGDIKLGIAAGMFGYLVANGKIPSSLIGHRLREEFCDPTKK
jgi:RHS repeat-associated protein